MTFNSIQEKIIFYILPLILFSLMPFFLITGPFLSDLSISIISLLFIIYCIKKKTFSYFKNRYFYFFLILCIYLIINSLINNFNLDSLKISVFYIRYGIFVIAIASLLTFNSESIKYFFFVVLICFTALVLDGFYEYFTGANILGYSNNESSRVASFFGNEKILGSYISRLWPIFFGLSLFFFKQKDKSYFLLIIIFILSEVLIFISGDRTAFFNINLSAIFVILFSRKLLKVRLIILICTILLLGVISMINPTAKQRVFDYTITQMKGNAERQPDENNSIYIFTKTHTHHYITAYRMYLDNKILGVGVKNFRKFCSDDKYEVSKLSCASHPHNTYLQILSETGLIGFFFLIIILVIFCKNIIQHFIYKLKGRYLFNDFEICILSGVAIYLWPIIPTGNIFSNWLNIIMILNLPFLLWSKNSIKFKKT